MVCTAGPHSKSRQRESSLSFTRSWVRTDSIPTPDWPLTRKAICLARPFPAERHDGVAFEITAEGDETVLHSFAGKDDATPYSGLIVDQQDVLYGTTGFGGT